MAGMRITRRFHACVDYTHGDTTVTVDPGSFETPENLGFILNGTVFQTGDSFPRLSERLRGVETVLIPVSAPWLKMLDVDTYLGESKPPRFIGIHDGIDNDNGVTLRTGLLTKLAQHHDLEFTPLRPGESVEV